MPVEIPLTRGYVALIDDEDVERVSAHRWWAVPGGRPAGKMYAYTQISRKTVYLHRFVLAPMPFRALVDHRNGDSLDCRKSNLRIATGTLNNANAKVAVGISGYRGVHRSSRKDSAWRAVIEVGGRVTRITGFRNPEDAARAYDELARVHFGEFATLNFPTPQAVSV